MRQRQVCSILIEPRCSLHVGPVRARQSQVGLLATYGQLQPRNMEASRQHLPAPSSQLPHEHPRMAGTGCRHGSGQATWTSKCQNLAPTCRLTRGISAQAPEDIGPSRARLSTCCPPAVPLHRACCSMYMYVCTVLCGISPMMPDQPGRLSFQGPVVHVPLACSAVVGRCVIALWLCALFASSFANICSVDGCICTRQTAQRKARNAQRTRQLVLISDSGLSTEETHTSTLVWALHHA